MSARDLTAAVTSKYTAIQRQRIEQAAKQTTNKQTHASPQPANAISIQIARMAQRAHGHFSTKTVGKSRPPSATSVSAPMSATLTKAAFP
jgi:hypothetical protein